MKRSVKLSQAMDEASDALYEEIKTVVDALPYLDLKASQLNNLVSVAHASTEVNGVAKFLQHQMSRDNKDVQGWFEQGSTPKSIGDIVAEYSGKRSLPHATEVLTAAGEISNKPAEREVAIELIRRYCTTFSTLYRYQKVVRGANHG